MKDLVVHSVMKDEGIVFIENRIHTRGRGSEICLHESSDVQKGTSSRVGGSSINQSFEATSTYTQVKKGGGAGRVWGTLSMCTSGAVQSAIRQFCSIDSVNVRRKSEELPNGKVLW